MDCWCDGVKWAAMFGKKFKFSEGFTLIEILIVIAIIGVLAVAFLPSVLNAPAKARDAQRIEDVGKLNNFFALQYAVSGSAAGGVSLLEPGKEGVGAIDLLESNLSDFSGTFPVDPGNGSESYYWYLNMKDVGLGSLSPYAFVIMATVEDTENGNLNGADLGRFFQGQINLGESGDRYVQVTQK